MEPNGHIVADLPERLLAEVVALPDSEQAAALERLCAQHRELAADLQTRYGVFRRLAHCSGSSAAAGERPQRFGEYELVRELGRGGMGVVYLARQRRADQERLVALKLVRDRLLLSPQARERLRREGAAAFRLDHPGICPALDVGEVDGTPFVAMRYVPGRTLAAWIAEARAQGRLPDPASQVQDESGSSTGTSPGGSRIRVLLALVEQVARALHAAHEAGYVHRDVKPGNIMVTPDGTPVLLDFGLVHDESSSHGITMTDQPLGTPAYMSPEQIEPAGRPADRTTDVWSLGVTLFEALAGEAPFQAHNREALFRQILDRELPDLRRRVPGISRDLAVVLATALRKEPGRRYATALAMAEDLRRVRLAQPILARPPGVARRMQLWARRNRLAAAVLSLLVLSQAVIVVLAVRAEERSLEALAAKSEANAARARAEEDYAAARDAVADLTQVAQKHLADIPWMEIVRRELFEKTLTFHRRVLARPATTPEQHLQAAIAKVQSASVHKDLGDQDAARQLATAAIEALAARAAGEPSAKRWTAAGHLLLAKLDEGHGAFGDAEAHYRAAIALLDDLVSSGSARRGGDSDLAQCLRRLAAMIVNLGNRRAEAEAAIGRALELSSGPRDAPASTERAACLRLRARMRRDQGDHAGAGEDLLAAIKALRDVLAEHPQDSEAKATLATTLVSIGVLQVELGQDEQALASYAEACALHEGLVAAFPFVRQHKGNLAGTLSNLAAQQRRSALHEESRKALQRCIELCEELQRSDPANAKYREWLAGACFNLANQLKTEDQERAIALYRQGLAAAMANLEQAPTERVALDLACRLATSLGGQLAARQDDAEALAMFGKAREFGDRLLQHHTLPASARRNLAVLHYNEGSLACEVGDLAAARARLRAAVAFDEALLQPRPDDLRSRMLLLSHRLRLALVEELIDPVAAGPAWQAAVDVVPVDHLAALVSDDIGGYDLGCALRGLAASRRRAGQPDDAAQLLARAAELIGKPDNLASAVEWLLLARDRAELAMAKGDAASAASAVATLAEQAAAVAPNILKSRLQTARLRHAAPAIEALLQAPGHEAALAAWHELAAVLAR